MSKQLDLTVKSSVNFRVTKGVSYPAITWEMEGLDVGYTITLEKYNNGLDKEFTVGNGITLVDGNKIVWDLGLIDGEVGMYKGILKTDSTIYGVVYFCDIQMQIIE